MNLKLEHSIIRDWSLKDVESLQRYANNRAIWKNLRDIFPHPYTREHAVGFITHLLSEKPVKTFAIATNMEAIGCIGLRMESDVNRLTAELGYWLAEPFWRKGIMSEVIRAFVPWAFTEFEFVRIEAEVFETNTASAKVLEKVGFSREGRLRSKIIKDGVIQDSIVYSQLRDESSGHLPKV